MSTINYIDLTIDTKTTKMIDGEEYITIEQCASILKKSKQTIIKLVLLKKQFYSFKEGLHHWIKKEDIWNYVTFKQEEAILNKYLSERRQFFNNEYKKERLKIIHKIKK